MSTLECITLIGVLVSLIIGIASIIISVKSLKQNSKMIKNSTRPYITIYFSTINNADAKGIFTIKNFGKTSAIITEFIYNPQLNNSYWGENKYKKAFESIKNTYLAPGQKQLITYQPKSDEIPKGYCDFIIKYTDGIETYTETCSINVDNLCYIGKLRHNTENNELKDISYALQEISEQML